MSVLRIMSWPELVSERYSLIGREFDYVDSKNEIRRGKIGNVDGINGFLMIDLSYGSRLINSKTEEYLIDQQNGCVIQLNCLAMLVYLWKNGDISFQTPDTGLDRAFLVRAPDTIESFLYAV